MQPMTAHRVPESGVGGDDMGPEALRERQGFRLHQFSADRAAPQGVTGLQQPE